jgi:hypothetical protein
MSWAQIVAPEFAFAVALDSEFVFRSHMNSPDGEFVGLVLCEEPGMMYLKDYNTERHGESRREGERGRSRECVRIREQYVEEEMNVDGRNIRMTRAHSDTPTWTCYSCIRSLLGRSLSCVR